MEKKNTATSEEKRSITINGTSYPLVITMGAFLEFYRLTGREATEIKSESLSDTLIFLHCILKAGQKREGYTYTYETADELASSLTPEEMQGIKLG